MFFTTDQTVGGLTLPLFRGAIAALLMATPQTAAANPAQVCDQAARMAASETGVPLTVLQAITRVETGRKTPQGLQPWPWTVNMEGKGHWFDTEDAARSYVFAEYKDGARSFDVGCFQVNHRWHGQAFASIEQMFDPLANARYAASFLAQLHAELGDWEEAAGAYHSRTPQYANKYKARFARLQSALLEGTGNSAPPPRSKTRPAETAINRYPLLLSGANPGNLGSLVPASAGEGSGPFIPIGTMRQQDDPS